MKSQTRVRWTQHEKELTIYLIKEKYNYKVAIALRRTTSAVCNQVAKLRTEGYFITPSYKHSKTSLNISSKAPPIPSSTTSQQLVKWQKIDNVFTNALPYIVVIFFISIMSVMLILD
jgi:hypothetical protein